MTDIAASIGIDFDARFVAMMVVVFFAGVIRGFTGFGSALLAVPALAVIYGPVQAVVIEVLIEIPVSLGLLPVALKEAQRKTVLPMLMMFGLFVPVGTLLLVVINPDYVKIAISVFVLFSVALLWQQKRVAQLLSPRANLVVGAMSGTTQGLTGMAGPLFVTALLARGENSVLTRANISALAAGIVTFSVISFWAFGLLSAQLVFVAALASPSILLGVWIGAVVFRKSTRIKLREVILGFLAITAIFTLYDTLG